MGANLARSCSAEAPESEISKPMRMKKRPVSRSSYCWLSRMLPPCSTRKPVTACTMPGRSGQMIVSTNSFPAAPAAGDRDIWLLLEVCRRDSVAELGPTSRDVRRELLTDRVVQRRRLVVGEDLAVDVAGPGGRVVAAVAGPALEVLRRRQDRPVEAVTEPLERVHRAEEMAAVPDLGVCVERQRRLVDLQRRELVLQHLHQLDVDDELL